MTTKMVPNDSQMVPNDFQMAPNDFQMFPNLITDFWYFMVRVQKNGFKGSKVQKTLFDPLKPGFFDSDHKIPKFLNFITDIWYFMVRVKKPGFKGSKEQKTVFDPLNFFLFVSGPNRNGRTFPYLKETAAADFEAWQCLVIFICKCSVSRTI